MALNAFSTKNSIILKQYINSQIRNINLKPYQRKPFTASIKPKPRTMSSVEESDVGILCYISNLPGFTGILKQRYSDFIVNEVDLEGNVVHLTSLEAPSEISEEKEAQSTDPLNKDYSAELESFKNLAGDSDAETLKIYIDKISSGTCNDESIVLSPSCDKSHRTAIHIFFKERLKFLCTDTTDGPDSSSKCIRVRLNKGSGKGMNSRKRKDRNGNCYDDRGSDSWPAHLGKFLRFHLYKENKDTQEALGLLAKMLGVQPRSFGFCGTKDKRAVSTQMVTVFKQRAGKLSALNKKLMGIKVGNFCHVNEELVLGQLQGNRFTITLRSIVAENEDLTKASAKALGENGFINYFGLQRFGSGSIPTHLIGAALLRGEWKAAVSMILDPRDGEKDDTRKIREYYKESGDIHGTLRQLPRYLVAERAILHSFQKSPGNYLQALLAVPRTLRMMFVHSYQSFLWNHAASMRVQKYGFNQVVLGDLVYCKEQDAEGEILSEENGVSGDGNADFHLNDEAVTDLPEERTGSVKVINEEDLLTGKYTVDDVVLPLPGSRVIYPLNDAGKVYHDLAEKDGISLTESAHSSKEFSLTNITGAYRRVFQKLKDFEWELIRYTDKNIPLAETDLDIISKSRVADSGKHSDENDIVALQKCCNTEAEKTSNAVETPSAETVDRQSDAKDKTKQLDETIDATNEHKSQIALKLSFTLAASCYATMAIRELLKTSTSVAYHKALN